MRRLLSILILCALGVPALGTGHAFAHGPLLKGAVIAGNGNIVGTTGNCNCNWQYYTVGLQRGHVRVLLNVHKVSRVIAPSYGVALYLTDANSGRTVQSSRAGCFAKQKGCTLSPFLRYVVPRSGIYYVQVSGLGADGMRYTMRVLGPIYRLRCAKYC